MRHVVTVVAMYIVLVLMASLSEDMGGHNTNDTLLRFILLIGVNLLVHSWDQPPDRP